MRGPKTRGGAETDSYVEIRLMTVAALAILVFTLLIPAILRAVDANGDNLDDAWEARYGITTGAYASTNLVGWWQLDGPTQAIDRSPNQINGTLGGFTGNAFGPGLFSNALYFTPQAHVDFPTNSALNTPNGLTFSAWIKSVNGATNDAVIATWIDTATNSWSVGINTKGMAQISFADAAGNTQIVGPSTNSATLYDGTWHHLAATWAPGQEARVYVDGENQDSGMIAAWTPGTVAAFSFGTPDDSVTNQTFILDETRLYNRALGPNEITQLPVTYTDLNGSGLSVWEDFQRGLNPIAPYTGSDIAPVNSVPVLTGEPSSSDFTPWMANPEFGNFLLKLRGTKAHPSAYWGNGHWINAVEGRWHDGVAQYRITYGPKPKHKALWWYWYLGIGQQSFKQHAGEMAAQGYTLLDGNYYTKPDGTRRYQGVWHKVIAPDVVAAAAVPRSK